MIGPHICVKFRSWDVQSLDSRLPYKSRLHSSVDSLQAGTSSDTIHDADSYFHAECNQIFIGMVTMQYQAKQVSQLKLVCLNIFTARTRRMTDGNIFNLPRGGGGTTVQSQFEGYPRMGEGYLRLRMGGGYPRAGWDTSPQTGWDTPPPSSRWMGYPPPNPPLHRDSSTASTCYATGCKFLMWRLQCFDDFLCVFVYIQC